MTVREARNILEQDAVGLTDADIQGIIDWLENFADMSIELVFESATDSLKL